MGGVNKTDLGGNIGGRTEADNFWQGNIGGREGRMVGGRIKQFWEGTLTPGR